MNFNNFNDLNELNLNDLKTILYKNISINDIFKNKIKNLIEYKINQTNIKKNKQNNLTSNKSTKSNSTESDESTKTESDDSKNSKGLLISNNDINKLYDRTDRKGQNQHLTQTSKKLLDRMFGINNHEVVNNTNVIVKPYADSNNNNKLGMRKNIFRK